MDNSAFDKLKLVGTVVLGIAMALSVAGCETLENLTRTVTPNQYSESVGPAQVGADEDACFEYGYTETRRLLDELLAGDPSVGANEARESGAEAVGRTLSDLEGGSTMAGDIAAGVAGFLFSSNDVDTYDESNLANYLGIDGGLGAGMSASKRLQGTCLRAKGYIVEADEEDGTGTAHLAWADPAGITRVVLREENGSERVFYEYVTPSKR